MNNQLKHSHTQNNPGHAIKRTDGITRIKLLAAALALTASAAHAESLEVKTFDVFVDPPSAFTFVKMPQGWTFVGKLDAQTLRALPASVHTSILDTNAESTSVSVAEPSFIWSNVSRPAAQSDPVNTATIAATSTFIWSNVEHSEPAPNALDAATILVNPTFIWSNVGSAASGTEAASGTASGAFARFTPATAD